MISRLFLSLLLVFGCVSVWAQDGPPTGKYGQEDKFRQLEEILPTPNNYRTASGAPGRGYWQQRANYHINVELDDENQRIIGSETITYLNRSPDSLNYLWLQLDANIFARGSNAATTATRSNISRLSYNQLKTLLVRETFDGGVNITSVHDAADKPLKHTIVKTMMRIDLDKPLASGESLLF